MERREIDVALVPPRPGPEKLAQCTKFRADGFAPPLCAKSLSKVQSVDQRMCLGMRCRLSPNADIQAMLLCVRRWRDSAQPKAVTCRSRS